MSRSILNLQAPSIASSAFPSRAPSPSSAHRSSSIGVDDGPDDPADPVKTVLVLGGSYSGAHAADVLARELPNKTKGRWRVVLVERNSHFHHVYHFPRYAVVPGHAHKAFVPYTRLLAQHDRDHPNADVSANNTAEAASVDDPDRFVSAVSDLKATLDAANNASSHAHTRFAPPKHHVVHASVDHIGRNYIDLDRPVTLPYTVSVSGGLEALHDHPGEGREYACGEEGCCGGRECCVEMDSGYGSSSFVVEEKGDARVRNGTSRESGGSRRSAGGRRESPPRRAPASQTRRVGWDYLIYALGSHPPPPLQLPSHLPTGEPWKRDKRSGVDFLDFQGREIERAGRVVIIGGGALGIQYATDIASLYPTASDKAKKITLIHSRPAFLPLYSPVIDEAVKGSLDKLGVERVMGERVDMAFLRQELERWKSAKERGVEGPTVTVRTLAGREIEADYVLLCTGQTPNTALMASFCPLAVPGGSHGGGAIKVRRSMQIAPSRWGPSPVERSDGTAAVPIDLSSAKNREKRSGTSGSEENEEVKESEGKKEVDACECATTAPPTEHKRLWEFDEPSANGAHRDALRTADAHPDASGNKDEEADPIWNRVFAVGDCADAFGAIKAGHTGWNQAEVAAKNVLRMIRWEERGGKVEELDIADEGEDVEGGEGREGKLARYERSLPMMKLTLGLGSSISQLVSMTEPGKLEITRQETGAPDAHWQHQWRSMGLSGECDGWD